MIPGFSLIVGTEKASAGQNRAEAAVAADACRTGRFSGEPASDDFRVADQRAGERHAVADLLREQPFRRGGVADAADQQERNRKPAPELARAFLIINRAVRLRVDGADRAQQRPRLRDSARKLHRIEAMPLEFAAEPDALGGAEAARREILAVDFSEDRIVPADFGPDRPEYFQEQPGPVFRAYLRMRRNGDCKNRRETG